MVFPDDNADGSSGINPDLVSRKEAEIKSLELMKNLAPFFGPKSILIIGASKDLLHEPQNLIQMDKMLPNSTLLDMETNTFAHGPELVYEIRKYIASLIK